MVAQVTVVVSFDVLREYERAVGTRQGGAADGAVDAGLLRSPRPDRPRMIYPSDIPIPRHALVNLQTLQRMTQGLGEARIPLYGALQRELQLLPGTLTRQVLTSLGLLGHLLKRGVLALTSMILSCLEANLPAQTGI